jgi:hypothetical protein
VGLALCLSAAIPAGAQAGDDEDVVLPSRVAAAINRAEASLIAVEAHVDEHEYPQALVSLQSIRDNITRADKAARRRMNAVPADPEAEVVPGPASVIGVLTLEQEAVERLAGLFDQENGDVVAALSTTLSTDAADARPPPSAPRRRVP